jgi:hypothetical protein
MEKRRWRAIVPGLFALAVLAFVSPASAVETEVTVGSNDQIFSQNKQNEPAIAVDHGRLARGQAPLVLAAGANDNIDMEGCNAGDDTTCPFTPNVGGTGIQFSFNGGKSWVQPTYTGWTARHCLGAPGGSDDPPSPDACVVRQGPIGTLPRYDELGIVSDGDPALAFGPRPGPGGFSWANGSRLYVANLTSAVTADFRETRKPAFKGFEAIYVSRTDNVERAAAGDESAWFLPVRASRQSSATFADKEQIWADNAQSSLFFGNVYVCWADFRGLGAAPLVVARSTDGGDTWEQKQVSPAHNVAAKQWGQSGCTIRTDSTGVVYVFYQQFQNPLHPAVGFPFTATHFMVKSFDGGLSWTRPRAIERNVDPCFFVDEVLGRCVMDGIAGARSDLAASPSVDIANGAPTGSDATNLIVRTWVDGRTGFNSESVMVSWSRTGGDTWSASVPIQDAGDRGYYSAPAVTPNGNRVYIVYNAFTTPFQATTLTPRTLVGVVKQANADGGLSGWTTVHRTPATPRGDPRGSSQNNLVGEFLGDYVYAIATRTYGAAVWNDAREASDCPAMDAWRMAIRDADPTDPPPPAPQPGGISPSGTCPATFGNTDIWAWTNAP